MSGSGRPIENGIMPQCYAGQIPTPPKLLKRGLISLLAIKGLFNKEKKAGK